MQKLHVMININNRYITSIYFVNNINSLQGVLIMKNNKAVIILIVILTLTLLFMLAGCSDYGYSFHFRVVGGNGEITTENSDWLTRAELCNNDKYESWPCELDNCPEGSRVIRTLGNKRSSCAITF